MPSASSIDTANDGTAAFALAAAGCVVKTSFAAAPGVTVSVAVTFCGLFVTPVAVDVIGTVALYVPTPSDPSVGVKVSVAGAVDVFSVAASHPVGWPAPNVIVPTVRLPSVPVPPFTIGTVCEAGLVPPACAEKLAAGEEIPIDGVFAGPVVVLPAELSALLPHEIVKIAVRTNGIRRMPPRAPSDVSNGDVSEW